MIGLEWVLLILNREKSAHARTRDGRASNPSLTLRGGGGVFLLAVSTTLRPLKSQKETRQ